MTNFPTSVDDTTSLPDPSPTSSTLGSHSELHVNENAAIRALEAKLGTGNTLPSGSSQVLYTTASGASIWGNLPVGGDLAGTLPNPTVPGLAGKQATLVSGTNIKTINGSSILGSGNLTIAGGGGTASSPLTTKGDIWVYSSLDTRLPVGTDGFLLSADSTQSSGLKWITAPTGGGTGTVSSVSVTSANGFAGTVVTPTTTPAITLSTSVTGVLKGNGTAISAATAGTDYSVGTSALATGILKTTTATGALSIAIAADFPTLNQNTTGSAATLTTARTIGTLTGDVTSTGSTFNGSANNTNATTVTKINGTSLAGLATGILKNTTTTGVPSIAVAADFPTLNQNTTGTAAGLSANIAESQVTNLTTDLAAKAPLASPALTGTPTAPTAATNTSTTQVATTAFVQAQAGTQSIVDNEVPGGTVNGSNTIFTLASTPATNSLLLYKNGIRLKGGGADYTLSGSTITFVTAPATGAVLLADYNVSNTVYSVGTNSIISDEAPSGTINGSNTTYTLTRAYIAGALEVYVNGVKQTRGTHFTETTPASGIFTMSDAPLTGDNVTCNYQFNLNPSSNADTVDGIHANATPTAGQLYPLQAKVVDANGWTVYNYGAWIVYSKTFTGNATIGSGANSSIISAASLPVGVSTVGSNVLLGYKTNPDAGRYSYSLSGTASSTTLTVIAVNTYGGSSLTEAWEVTVQLTV